MLLALAKLNGETSLVEGRTVEQARAENRAEVPIVCGPPRPMARVEELRIPGPAGRSPARLYVALGAPQRPAAAARLLPRRRLGDRRPRHPRQRLPLPRRAQRLPRALGRLPPGARSTPSRRRSKTRSPPLPGRREHAAELGADPARIAVGGDSAGGNLAAAVCLQARDAGSPQPAMQLLLYPVTDAVGGQPSRDTFAEGFLLTREDMEWFENHYIPDGSDDADPRASMMRADGRLRPAPRLRRHRRLRSAARRGRELRRRGCARPACRWSCGATPA